MEIQIHQRDPKIRISEQELIELTRSVAGSIDLQAKSCEIIFVDDVTLAEMHAKFLDDPDKTDVITFDLGDEVTEGEIYISTDRARAQAESYAVTAEEEVLRLIIHGLLHLKGFDDREKDDLLEMKKHENELVEKYSGQLKKGDI